jgi:competence protein ComEA
MINTQGALLPLSSQELMNSLSRSQAFVVLLLALVLLSAYGWNYHKQQSRSRKSHRLSTQYVFIQVSGEVKSPGIYSFDKPVTVSQAVARAGGLLPPLRPGDRRGWASEPIGNNSRIHLTDDSKGGAHLRLGWMTVPNRLALGVPLDINQASVADLSQVPGIGPKLAKGIVALRIREGEFSKLENLCKVRGIGPATVRRLKTYLTLGTKD